MGDADHSVRGPDDPDPGASDESRRCQMRDILKRLKTDQLISDQCHDYGLQLVGDTSRNQEHSKHLSSFLEHLLKSLTQKPASSEKSQEGWLSGWLPKVKHKAKVFTLVSGETFSAHKQIKHKLKSEVDMVSKPQECDVIVLLCPISTRLGSDVEAALKTIPESGRAKPVILVLMHHTRKSYYSADETKWANESSVVASYVHVLFHETQKGLLTCPKNDQAIQSLLAQCINYEK